MDQTFSNNRRIGILGGGQLGRMLIQRGLDFNVSFSVLDANPASPCRAISNFFIGRVTDYDTVLNFGMQCDLITIEIEHVNVDALEELARRGRVIIPQPNVIKTIQHKGTQKRFFEKHDIPTSAFIVVKNRQELMKTRFFFPSVNKLAREGYDGKGVQTLYSESDLGKSFDAPSILEKQVDIDKEISVIVARDAQGSIIAYPAVEMFFHKGKNILNYLVDPADIQESILKKASEIACNIIEKLDMIGVLAVEMFLSKTGELLVNEIAPRPHNSGHHTIEAYATSQYEQHLRILLGLPLARADRRSFSAMINLLGETPDFLESNNHKNLAWVFSIQGASLHLYGKQEAKPFRKMGHITLLAEDRKKLQQKIDLIQQNLTIIP